MFLNSIKEINRPRKEINRLLSKGMLKVTIDKKWCTQNFDFKSFKKFVSRSVLGELQLMQISLNFQTFCCSLKIRDFGAKLCVPFLLFLF